MKAEELRIGNLVLLPGGALHSLERSDFKYERGLTNIEDLRPVPITEQWLKDFGFKKGRKGFWFQGGVEYNPKKFDLSFFGYVEIKYVYQLQNLYFSLTGEELQL